MTVGALVHRLRRSASPPLPFVVDVTPAPDGTGPLIGGAGSRLSGLYDQMGFPAPDGFMVTEAGCAAIAADAGGRTGASSAVLEAFDRLAGRTGHRRPAAWVRLVPFDAVSSVSAEEAGDRAEAARFGVPNVLRDDLLGACRATVARAGDDRAVLSVTMMVDARASGMLQTDDPAHPGVTTITGAWGFTLVAGGGPAPPDLFRVARNERGDIVEARIALKARMRLARETGGLQDVAVPGWMQRQPCLTRDQIARLAGAAARIERRPQGPHEIEWAADASERILILGCRPGAGRR